MSRKATLAIQSGPAGWQFTCLNTAEGAAATGTDLAAAVDESLRQVRKLDKSHPGHLESPPLVITVPVGKRKWRRQQAALAWELDATGRFPVLTDQMAARVMMWVNACGGWRMTPVPADGEPDRPRAQRERS